MSNFETIRISLPASDPANQAAVRAKIGAASASDLTAHIDDPTAAHAASAISFAAGGGISSTTVQAAIAELDTGKQPLDSDLTSYANAADAAARRDLIGATAGVFPGALVASATTTTAGVTLLGGPNPAAAATVGQLTDRDRGIYLTPSTLVGSTSGTGAGTTADSSTWSATSGATAGSTVVTAARNFIFCRGQPPTSIDFTQAARLAFRLSLASTSANAVLRAGIFRSSGSLAYAAITIRGFGVEIRNTALWGIAHDGVTLSEVSLGTLTVGQSVDIIITKAANGQTVFSVNGTDSAPITGPSATFAIRHYGLEATNGADSSAAALVTSIPLWLN